jgi:hypothetical protein
VPLIKAQKTAPLPATVFRRPPHQRIILFCEAGPDKRRRLRWARPPQLCNTLNRLVRFQLQRTQLCEKLPVPWLDVWKKGPEVWGWGVGDGRMEA